MAVRLNSRFDDLLINPTCAEIFLSTAYSVENADACKRSAKFEAFTQPAFETIASLADFLGQRVGLQKKIFLMKKFGSACFSI